MPSVALRPVEDADLDTLFEKMRDPESVRMAAFTAEDPDDRAAFDAHMARRGLLRLAQGVGGERCHAVGERDAGGEG